MALHWVDTLVWPAVIVTVLLVFRHQVAGVLGRITRLGLPGGPYAEMEPPQQGQGIGLAEVPLHPSEDVALTKAVEETDPKIRAAQQEAEARAQDAALYLTYYQYERLYRLLFGTQIGLLFQINPRFEGAAASELAWFHEEHLRQMRLANPGYNYPFENYIDFLKSNQVLNEESGRYFITDYGRGFLQYLTEFRLPLIKPL